MKKFVFILILTIIPSWMMNAQWTVQSVPNPKSVNGGYVSNPDNILSSAEISNLNSIIKTADDSAKIQVAVVTLKSIGTAVPKEFATSLFNYWGIGNKTTNNGLLVLFVLDQRRIEIEVGYGLESILTDAACYQVQQDFMVPEFKAGNFGQGIIKGVTRVIEIAGGTGSLSQPLIAQNESTESYPTESYNNNQSKSTNNSYYSFLGIYIRIALFMALLYVILFCVTMFQDDYFKRYKTLRIFKLYFWFILFPIPFIPLYYLTKKMMDTWRNTPRISPKTGKLMRKLSEDIDDQYLESGQVTEEAVKSIDYDVWISDEPGDILILSYKRWFSEYSSCPKCNYKTYYKEYDRVIRSATYSSSGEGERKYTCKNCKHSKTSRYTIPRKTRSSSSSYRSSSFGGSSSYGGSFGGGRSGGGGAGSSW